MANSLDLERWHRKSAAQLADPAKIDKAHRAALRELLKTENESNEAVTSSTQSNRRRQQRTTRRSNRGSSPPPGADGAEAWMCGVCGFVYSSRETCEQHEKEHVRTVVAGLGFLAEDAQRQEESIDSDYNQAIWPNTSEDDLLGFEADIAGVLAAPGPGPPGRQGSTGVNSNDSILLETNTNSILFADRALIQVVKEQAEPLMLTAEEKDAEHALKCLAEDALHYEMLASRAAERKQNPSQRFRQPEEEAGALGKVQNKLLDAYQLMKESDGKKGISDCYTSKPANEDGNEKADISAAFSHLSHTLYVNVMVKNSVQVVCHELERLAKRRWEKQSGNDAKDEPSSRFERFRSLTQTKAVKLTSLLLSSDFTPRRIAVQLSNDLYRMLTPRLLRRGVSISAELEYRVGPYFCMAVNIQGIQWMKLLAVTARDVRRRQLSESSTQSDEKTKDRIQFYFIDLPKRLYHLSLMDGVAYSFSLLHRFHWAIAIPVCWFAYQILGTAIRKFILASVMDEVFSFVESKGMEMDVKAFMLQALREIRADGQELKKKQQDSDSVDATILLGPLLGPTIAADANDAPPVDSLELPANLEFIGLELELPIGFRRLRWALLHHDSRFIADVLFKTEAKYENIVIGEWSKCNESIGNPGESDSVNPEEFIGAEKEAEYLMPKSAFVSANMCYESQVLIAYNDDCFCLKKRARNPDAPFGKTFVAWTQYLVVNTGKNTCKLTCSVEAEFPNGEPMVSRQIRSGMRAGTGELFVLIGETVGKYANEFP